jgi:hypothetical protein
MYGTIARLRARPGAAADLASITSGYEELAVPGFVSSHLYQADGDDDEFWMAVVFVDRESYLLNAQDPAQDARYREMRALLAADPEWHDGQIVATAGTGATTGGPGAAGGGF